ncbi:hypothetical protein ANTQUA_LOCUS1687 [Anthophora quadrimaculata]
MLLTSRSREIRKCIKTQLDHIMSLGRSSVITRGINEDDAQQKPRVFASTQAPKYSLCSVNTCVSSNKRCQGTGNGIVDNTKIQFRKRV